MSQPAPLPPPLGLGIGKLIRTDFFKHKDAVGGVVLPALIGMLLFWAILIAASFIEAYELMPLILAIGMSMHWPVIGWSYNRTIIYSSHAIIRALLVLLIFTQFPEHLLTWMPLAVAACYAVTIILILSSVATGSRSHPEIMT